MLKMFELWILLGCLSLELMLGTTMDLQPQCFTVTESNCPNSNVSFWLYTQEDPNGRLLNPESFSGYGSSPKPLKVLLHSVSGNRNTSPNPEVRPELLRIPNINIISVDYGNLTPDPCYIESTINIHVVTLCLAEFLGHLIDVRFVRADQVHLIGQGLGAHAAAFTANHLETKYSKISHITALDPAKALFLTQDLSKRIDPSDATFVDVIHTDIFVHGLMQPVGHIDFYPNKGVVQPKCGPIDNIDTHECYHKRAAEFYAESIFTKIIFWAFRCKGLFSFLSGECQPNNDFVELGYHTRPTARGVYFLGTNESPPYARGMNFTDMDRKLEGKTFMPSDLFLKLAEKEGFFKTITSST